MIPIFTALPDIQNLPGNISIPVRDPALAAVGGDCNGNGVRSLNVPFCLNIMAGGKDGGAVSFTSMSWEADNHLQRTVEVGESPGIALHQHDFFELMIVFEGDVEQQIEDGIYRYRRGQACLLNRNTRHHEVLGMGILVFLCLSREFVRAILPEAAGNTGMPEPLHRFFRENLGAQAEFRKDYLNFTPQAPPPEGEAGPLDAILEQLVEELLLSRPGCIHMVHGLVQRLLYALADPALYTCDHIALDSTAESYLFRKITRYMKGAGRAVSRGELAHALSYNSDYLNRIIKKRTGMSLSEYNQALCISRAEELLAGTDDGISAIIHALGFENRTHFYKLFKKKHGITPKEYRAFYRSLQDAAIGKPL
ncbi:AraC family transcriptional regulator [Ruminococcaceae bacterium OttesenSCG-928-L11]|nr:AraC family transcriptional regulator [Ruminococcaceae bacterium OttesenSCG-928-L11]